MPILYFDRLDDKNEIKIYCNFCKLPLCYAVEVIRDDYQCSGGRALFVNEM